AYPQAGRVTVQGQQLLYGKRLEDTELARDVRSPMTTSEVEALLAEETNLKTKLLPLDVVTGPGDRLVESIVGYLHDDTDVVGSDALTIEYIQRTAKAAVAAGGGVRWVTIDPGQASLAMAQGLGIRAQAQVAPNLVM